MKRTAIYALGLALGVAGCASAQANLVHRAAFDFSCPENQLAVQDLGGNTRGVTGCGKKATYVWSAGSGWVLNTASGQAEPQPPAAAAPSTPAPVTPGSAPSQTPAGHAPTSFASTPTSTHLSTSQPSPAGAQ